MMPPRRLPRPLAAGPLLGPLSLILAVLVTGACDEDFSDPSLIDDSQVQLTAISGNGQNGFVGSPLVRPLRVQVRDQRGAPAPQQRVQFRTVVGDGLFSATSGVTDMSGFTQVSFTPLNEGGLVVEAAVAGGPRTTFAITAIDRGRLENPAVFEIAGGNAQVGTVGTLLPVPLTVRVANEFDQPLANFPVLFTATTDGSILLTANEGDFIQSDTLGRPPSQVANRPRGGRQLLLRRRVVRSPPQPSRAATASCKSSGHHGARRGRSPRPGSRAVSTACAP